MEAHADDVPEKRGMPRTGLSNELIAILAVGVMLAGMVFTTGTWIRDDLRDDMQILRGDMRVLRDDMRVLSDEVRSVQSGLSELRERVVRIESVLQEDSIGRQG